MFLVKQLIKQFHDRLQYVRLDKYISVHYKSFRVIGVMLGTWEMAEARYSVKGIVLLV